MYNNHYWSTSSPGAPGLVSLMNDDNTVNIHMMVSKVFHVIDFRINNNFRKTTLCTTLLFILCFRAFCFHISYVGFPI